MKNSLPVSERDIGVKDMNKKFKVRNYGSDEI